MTGGLAGRIPPVGGLRSIFLREGDGWCRMPYGERTPAPVDVETVLAATGPSAAGPPVDPVAPDEVLDPVLPLFLCRDDEGLGLFPPGSPNFERLSRDEVSVLDALSRHATVEDVAARTGLTVDASGAAARRLAALGALHVLPPRSIGEDGGDSYPLTDLAKHEAPRDRDHPAMRPLDPTRIPVISPYRPHFGPPLALGMILASLRAWEGGRLNDVYEIRHVVTHDEARILLEGHVGPVVVLCSNYIWSCDDNLELVAELAESNPQLVGVHGGPHTPKYERDAEDFFRNPAVHVAVRGEGEYAAAEVLAALASTPRFADPIDLAAVDGVTYRDAASGELVRTPDRARIDDLDALPSPYLTGEFDDIHPASWILGLGGVVCHETNRGCPYQCTFCDWGSLTMARIRKFSMERVEAEMQWLADHDVLIWFPTDANFGILPRDVDIARRVARFHDETGTPQYWSVALAKNATRNLEKILDILVTAGINVVASLSLQTRDETTLEAVNRSNISVERYDALAGAFRRNRFPMICDLICGMPGATVESFKADLQWAIDHEITVRAWLCYVLPNSPMNDPEYRERHQIVIGDDHVVVATSSFTRADHAHMLDLRMGQRVFEHLGLMRHVMRYLQWDLGLPAMDVIEKFVLAARSDPESYPLLAWCLDYLDIVLLPPAGWQPFYAEVRRFLADELGVEDSPSLDTVIEVQLATLPDRGRSYPHVVDLPHDYVAYYTEATSSLQVDGTATGPRRPLSSYSPGRLTVTGDPAFLANSFGRLLADRSDDKLSGAFWTVTHFETDSPLTRSFTEVRATPGYTSMTGDVRPPEESAPAAASFAGTLPNPAEPIVDAAATVDAAPSWPVRLLRRRRVASR